MAALVVRVAVLARCVGAVTALWTAVASPEAGALLCMVFVTVGAGLACDAGPQPARSSTAVSAPPLSQVR